MAGGGLLAAFTPELIAAFPSLAPFLGAGGAGAQKLAERGGQCQTAMTGPQAKEFASTLARTDTSRVATVASREELGKLFEKLTQGGEPTQLNKSFQGEAVRLADGTLVTLREASKSGGATIEVVGDGFVRKIHIE